MPRDAICRGKLAALGEYETKLTTTRKEPR